MPVATVSPAANGSSIVVIIQGGTFAHGINDAGQIAGYSYSIVFVPKTIYGKVTGFLYSNGSLRPSTTPRRFQASSAPTQLARDIRGCLDRSAHASDGRLQRRRRARSVQCYPSRLVTAICDGIAAA
jgi:hypothetical protein